MQYIPGTMDTIYDFSGKSLEKIVQKKDPGNRENGDHGARDPGARAAGNGGELLIDVQSDLDLFIVGNVSYDDVIDMIVKKENEIWRPINFTIYKQEDLVSRIKNQDSFIMNVLNEPKIMLTGNEHEFKALGT